MLLDGDEATYGAHASEGGHSDFSPREDLEYELLKYLMAKFNQSSRVSVERVASGTGIENVYDFLSQHPKFQVNDLHVSHIKEGLHWSPRARPKDSKGRKYTQNAED